ncbi:MAG: DUF3037 domain-containing protein [Actinomycetales bacterium]
MTGRELFEYVVVRVVPDVRRGEQVNVGVIVYCQMRDVLDMAWHVDEQRLSALWPAVDVEGVRQSLAALEQVCRGGAVAGGIGARPPGERFRWLVAPRSTVVQHSAVHTGLTDAPEAEAERLLGCLVR